MHVILIGGGETIETIYFLSRLFANRGYAITIITPHLAEAQMLSHRVRATVLVGDGSDPDVLADAGARRADVVLSLSAYDPDNLVACQVAQALYGVPRTMALVNDPDNEEVFRQLGISLVFSATRIIGELIEGHTLHDEIRQLFPAAEGRVHVSDIELCTSAPAAGQSLSDLNLPGNSLIACIIRGTDVMVPRGDHRLQVSDHVILIAKPEDNQAAVRALTGGQA